jgi:putative heme iron utilization protein
VSNDVSLAAEANEFISTCKTAVLATVSPNDATPNASYAPYLKWKDRFYVLVSGLAQHTGNLLQSRKCHLMFLADEHESVNPFARKRVSYQCVATEVLREEERASQILDAMTDKFGPTIVMLRQLPDFRLIELYPQEGLFVRGFGQAFPLASH